MSQRTDRVDALLRQEIGEIMARDLSDPRIGFATVTDVETTPDLAHARIWVSVIGRPDERQATLAALGRAMPYVRHALGTRLRLRRIPELHVRLDETAERGTRLLRILSELEAGVEPEAISVVDESLPTPVARLPHEGDAPAEPVDRPAAERGRRRGRRPTRAGDARGGPDRDRGRRGR